VLRPSTAVELEPGAAADCELAASGAAGGERADALCKGSTVADDARATALVVLVAPQGLVAIASFSPPAAADTLLPARRSCHSPLYALLVLDTSLIFLSIACLNCRSTCSRVWPGCSCTAAKISLARAFEILPCAVSICCGIRWYSVASTRTGSVISLSLYDQSFFSLQSSSSSNSTQLAPGPRLLSSPPSHELLPCARAEVLRPSTAVELEPPITVDCSPVDSAFGICAVCFLFLAGGNAKAPPVPVSSCWTIAAEPEAVTCEPDCSAFMPPRSGAQSCRLKQSSCRSRTFVSCDRTALPL